ncbi:MAG: class I SAM-dependent methyltransferase, partial [Verrucomicrobiae bacterium]|nr:class I SAM-dependent methyltransferase [Verrucomicrobiae bacterium]
TETPVLMVWYRHYPSQFTLPSDLVAHLVPKASFHRWNVKFRGAYHVIEAEGERVPGVMVAEVACRMLKSPRYLTPDRIGADVKLQHHIDVLARGGWSGEDTYNDRHRSFDLMARHLSGVPHPFVMVETGTIRAREDWKGAGYSTYLFGELASLLGGKLISVDVEPTHCTFARLQTSGFGENVRIVLGDSVAYLADYTGDPIDVLYLDSLDTTVEGHAEHGLAEARHGAPHLRAGGLLAIDDTHFAKGAYHGKGALAVPWLLDQGFEVIYSGFQTLLRKPLK